MSLEHLDTLIGFALVMLLLSLLVTSLVESVNILLNARGRNLSWGVERVLEQFGFEHSDAQKLAVAVLRHRAVLQPKWLPWVRATAIRADELAMFAHEILTSKSLATGAGSKGAADKLAEAAQWMAATLPGKVPKERMDAIKELATSLGDQLDSLPAPVMASLQGKLASAVEECLDALDKRRAEVAGQLTNWFNATMDRTTERFVSQTRNTTVVLAAITCVGLHVDAIRLMRRLSTDDDLRTALVESAATTIDETGQMIEELNAGKGVADAALRAVAEHPPSGLSEAVKEKLAKASVEDQTRAGASAWIDREVTDPAQNEQVKTAFGTSFIDLLEQRQGKVEALRGNVVRRLEATQLDLFGGARHWTSGFYRQGEAGREFDGQHLVGLGIAVLFLSLGAPFWFNLLRNASNLRPIVARKVDSSEK